MIRSTLMAVTLGLGLIPMAQADCTASEFVPVAIVDAVAIHSAPYPNPAQRRRSHWGWAQAGADRDDHINVGQFTQFRVVRYLNGDGPAVIDVAHSLAFDYCATGVEFERGERYLLALTRRGDFLWVERGASASGANRQALLETGIPWDADGRVYEFGDFPRVEQIEFTVRPQPPRPRRAEPVAPLPDYPQLEPSRVGHSVLDEHRRADRE